MCEIFSNPPEWEDNRQSNTCKNRRKINKLSYLEYGQPWAFALELHFICKPVGLKSIKKGDSNGIRENMQIVEKLICLSR